MTMHQVIRASPLRQGKRHTNPCYVFQSSAIEAKHSEPFTSHQSTPSQKIQLQPSPSYVNKRVSASRMHSCSGRYKPEHAKI